MKKVFTLLITIFGFFGNGCDQRAVGLENASEISQLSIRVLKQKIVNSIEYDIEYSDKTSTLESYRVRHDCKNWVSPSFNDEARLLEFVRRSVCNSDSWVKDEKGGWIEEPIDNTDSGFLSAIPYSQIANMTVRVVNARTIAGTRTDGYFVEFGCPLEPDSKSRIRCVRREKASRPSDNDFDIRVSSKEKGEKLKDLLTELVRRLGSNL